MINKRRHKKNYINEIINSYVSKNISEYIIMIIILLIGIIFGIVYINKLGINEQKEIQEYINSFLSRTAEGNIIDSSNLLKTSLFNHILIIILLWISGLTVIGMPIVYLLVTLKGFCIGYTVSAIIATLGKVKGIKFVLSTMLLQNIIAIPCILIVAVSGVKLYKSIVKEGRRENIKVEILRYTIITCFISIVAIISALIETYLSANIFRFIFM